MPLQIRRGTEAERVAMTQPLAQGELLYVTNTQRIYVGNGSTLGGIPVTGYTDGNAKDAAATIFTSGSHTGINFSYNTATDIITATVDLSNYNGTINASALKGTIVADDSTILVDAVSGTIPATVISGTATINVIGNTTGYHTGDVKGSVFADDSTILVDAVAGSFNLDGTVKGNIVPDANEVYDLGSVTNRFRDIYLSGTSIKLGNATITATGAAVDLPVGSTVGGISIASSGDGVISGSNYNINIIRDDSTVIVNSSSGVITADTLYGTLFGTLEGDVSGSIFSDDSTIMLDGIDKVLTVNSINTTEINAEASRLFVKSSSPQPIDAVAITDGSTAPYIGLSVSRGTISSPTNTNANDILGGFKIEGYRAGVYKFASGMASIWASDADYSYTYPRSTFNLFTGNNSNMLAIGASLDGAGTWTANTIKTGTYTSAPDTRPTGSKGMIIFNDTTGKFQGFDGSSWVDLS